MMISGPRAMAALKALLERYRRESGGVAAVEFALILPFLVALWLGTVELSQALSLDRRISEVTASVGDLVARSPALSENDIANIFDITRTAMSPYSTAPAGIVVSAVDIDEDGKAAIAWSRARGRLPARPEGADMTAEIAEALRRPNSQVIVAEGSYAYRPTIGSAITGTMTLTERLFFVPRESEKVELCQDSQSGCGE
ncbi:TadE/TadG family type IV pilus assembly protein [Afifella pfennigii]|uniref:TadE/TadG family type IV pilus assembly protein n=1 Tax=Afifella pfennigii TaxID=209897 RepID=UPI00047D26D7|nr:TadE/TadG family type IV pilus assembly protein [Afifella pfennigii]